MGTRGGHEWTHRFPSIAAEAGKPDVTSAILDGEAVVLDKRGASDFGALQMALGGHGGKRSTEEALLYACDLLYLNGYDLRGMPLSDRRLPRMNSRLSLRLKTRGIGLRFPVNPNFGALS